MAVVLMMCGAWMPAQAQSLLMNDLGSGFQGAASVDLAYSHTDNFFYSPRGSNVVGAGGYFVRPNLLLDRDAGGASFKLRAAGEYANFDLPSSLSQYETYTLDGLASAALDWQLGTRNRVGAYAEIRHNHDAFGVLRPEVPGSTPVSSEKRHPDEWNQAFYSAKYRFGAQEAAINFELRGSDRDRTYLNNRSDNTQFLDYNTVNVGGTLFYNYSPKTSLLFDYEHYDTKFDRYDTPSVDDKSRDNTQDIYRAGIQWKATAKTTGDLRVGYSNQDFKHSKPPHKVNRVNWQGSLTWTPAVRTTFTLLSGRTSQESYLVAGNEQALSIDNRDNSLEWAQHWGSRFTTFAVARYIQSEFEQRTVTTVSGTPPVPVVSSVGRHDNIRSFGVTAEYAMIKYVSVLASVTRNDRSSTNSASEYETTLTYIGVRLIP